MVQIYVEITTLEFPVASLPAFASGGLGWLVFLDLVRFYNAPVSRLAGVLPDHTALFILLATSTSTTLISSLLCHDEPLGVGVVVGVVLLRFA